VGAREIPYNFLDAQAAASEGGVGKKAWSERECVKYHIFFVREVREVEKSKGRLMMGENRWQRGGQIVRVGGWISRAGEVSQYTSAWEESIQEESFGTHQKGNPKELPYGQPIQ